MLAEAVRRDFADAQLDIAPEEGPTVHVVVTGMGEADARATERAVLDLAWVVKQCAPWSVPA